MAVAGTSPASCSGRSADIEQSAPKPPQAPKFDTLRNDQAWLWFCHQDGGAEAEIGMNRLLLSLWLLGAAVYGANTLIYANVIFGHQAQGRG